MPIGEDLIGAVELLCCQRVLQRRCLFRYALGEHSEAWRCESLIAKTVGSERSLLLPSASSGLSLILEAANLRPGDEILLSPLSWVANFSAIRRRGLIPRFFGLNDRLEYASDEVFERVTSGTKAILVAHLMGRAQPGIRQIARECGRRELLLIEDCAQSFGVRLGPDPLGSFGHFGYTSFNTNKIVSAGDGGAVWASEGDAFERIWRIHDQGALCDRGKRRRTDSSLAGTSLRVNELSSALLNAQVCRMSFLRSRIRRLHFEVASILSCDQHVRVIEPLEGDIPYFVVVAADGDWYASYPRLADSGLHWARNVQFLSEAIAANSQDSDALDRTHRVLCRTLVFGAGLVDPYYSACVGVSIEDSQSPDLHLESHIRAQLGRYL